MSHGFRISAVTIGRNEGARLIAGLKSLQGQFDRVVYVDSGSTDGSQQAARELGAEVVLLDTSIPFTAARARNAGFAHLQRSGDRPDLVQFLDGDCILQPGWIETGAAALADAPDLAIVCGRCREVDADATIYNRLADDEWNTPVGEAKACGGNALIRAEAFERVEGFNPALIAGEEPELCVRLRQQGWRIERLDAEMNLHDVAMTRFGQWWTRVRRGGYAFAEGFALHGAPPERHYAAELRRIVIWAFLLPLVILIGALITPWALLLVLIWPLQVIRLRMRGEPWYRAAFLTLTKFPEAQGVLTYLWRRLTRGESRLIEYKS